MHGATCPITGVETLVCAQVFPPAGTLHRYFLAQGGLKKLIRQKISNVDAGFAEKYLGLSLFWEVPPLVII